MDAPPDRLAPFLERLAHLAVDDLAMLALPEPDPDERESLLQRALDAAVASGRGDEVRAAPGRARDAPGPTRSGHTTRHGSA